MAEEFALYHYDPSTALAAVFIFLFSNESLAHGWLLWRHGTWYFIPFLIGGIYKLILYIKSHQTGPLGPYVMQSLMILLAPILFAASMYMVLGRIIRLVDAKPYSPIRVGWLTKNFLWRKTSFPSSPRRQIKWGEHVIIAGLVIQLIFFGLFVVASWVFHCRIIRAPTQKAEAIWGLLRQYMLVLYAASFLIITLNAFRVIEYVQGSDGELMSKEMWIYIFDATLTFLVMLLFVIWHPSRIINRSAVASNDVESANGSHSMVTFWKRGTVQR
ncbi:RTA1 like protein-domain-containing protein [Phyllosticta paracitricarpa]|uniref:RTA1 like protein-domain-containing protein n=1 Tax=Phyllosticta paracitricarpa TaxID=2016321 RepID=A0ABR1N568_9PEZI